MIRFLFLLALLFVGSASAATVAHAPSLLGGLYWLWAWTPLTTTNVDGQALLAVDDSGDTTVQVSGTFGAGGTATITAGTGFTERGRLGANPTWGAIEEKAQTTAGSIAATWTLGTAHKYIASLVALKAAGGGGSGATSLPGEMKAAMRGRRGRH